MVQFRPVDAAIVRVCAWPSVAGELEPWPSLTGDTDNLVEHWRDWLGQVWQNEIVADGIKLASPDLADAVQAICGGYITASRRVRRTVESVMNYLLRMTTRATPFGLFAGVATVRLGTHAAVTWGSHHLAVARPDPIWLNSVVTALETNPDLFRQLTVVLNNLSYVRDGTLVVACQPYSEASGQGPSDVQVRITRPVQIVMDASRSPVTIAELIGNLSGAFPHLGEPVFVQLLAGLVANRILISDLWPAMHITDPIGYLTRYLAGRACEGEPLSLVDKLGSIGEDLAECSRVPVTSAARLRARAIATMTSITPRSRQPMTVDLRLDAAVALPPPVLDEAAVAAAVLVRLGQRPNGTLAWQHWHRLFLENYGEGTVVPVTESVNPDTGIGYPADFPGSQHRVPPPTETDLVREAALLRLAQNATFSHDQELNLDDEILDRLTSSADVQWVYPHTELRFAVHAPTLKALDRGEFSLAVTLASRQAGSSIGRFLHLIDPIEKQAVFEEFRSLPTLTENATTAQISCPPTVAHVQNVARTPPVFPLIPIAEHGYRAEKAVELDDLAVVGDTGRLYLVSMSTGHVIEPILLNALAFHTTAHPMVRFLCELPTARAAGCVPFFWGHAAERLPFLPRVRYRRTILRPATWNIVAADLPTRNAAWRRWADSWARLREIYRIPRSVLLGQHDTLIRLDLDEPAHLAILRTHLDRKDAAKLAEGPDHDAYGWLGGRPHEVVLPLASTAPPVPSAIFLERTRPRPATPLVIHPPGISPWLYARLCAHPARHTEIIARHLPELLLRWPGAWFLRYGTPEPHLRIRIPLASPNEYGNAARWVGAWAADLRHSGLVGDLLLDTYRPEVGRYGAGHAMAAAESVFTADSAVAVSQLVTSLDARGPHPIAMTVASMVDITSAFIGSTEAGMSWIISKIARRKSAPASRDISAAALHLSDPDTGFSSVASLPCGPEVLEAWGQRRDALRRYQTCTTEIGAGGQDLALGSLLHMHHVRAVGIDPESEQTCLHLVRSVALSWSARKSVKERSERSAS